MKRISALCLALLLFGSLAYAQINSGPITSASVQPASTTVAGKIETATNTEAAAASSTTVALVPGNTYGTFTGTTIADNPTIPSALQALESAVELRAVTTAPGTMGGTTSFLAYTKVPVTVNNGNLNATAAMLSNGYIEITGAGEVELIAGALGMAGTVRASGAFAVSVDPADGEVIVLNGTALAAGNKITSTSTANDTATLIHNGTNWVVIGPSVWTDGGA